MSETTNPPDPFQLCGTTIEGKYRIASVVGDGGFGVVYRGVHKGFGELIAVKCLKLSSSLDEKQRDALLEQLRDEGRILHRLSRATSGIVQALDVGAFTTPGGVWVPYLVLEWLEGETLAEFVRSRRERGEGGLPLAEAMQLLEPAARALAVAHGQKVAHRDVKPANLFVTQVGGARTLKVLDFGIAKVLTSNASITAALEATKLGPTAFTPRYGAPEQFNKQRGASGPWTDVFALALILVEIVSGKRALDGDDPTQLYIASADPTLRPTLRARGVEALESVEQVLEKALAVEPKHRYPDAGEFWDALVAARAAGGVPTRARLPSRPEPAVSEKHEMLATAEFAAQRKLDVSSDAPSTRNEAVAPAGISAEVGGAVLAAASEPPATPEPPSSGQRVGLEPTMPVESLRGKAAAPVRARSSNGSGAGAKAPVPERDVDSMAETPMPARGNQPVVRRSGGAIGDVGGGAPDRNKGVGRGAPDRIPAGAPPPSEVPGAPPAERAPAASSRAPWGWLTVGIVLVGAAAGYTMWRPDDPATLRPATSAGPSARASGQARPHASGAPVTSASAAATTSASASTPPPVPPEDMVYVAPATFTMGEGAAGREVVVSRGYFLERTEVTVRAYEACMTKRKCSAANHVVFAPDAGDGSGQPVTPDDFAETWGKRCNEPRHAADHPINCVDYSSAETYCAWKGRRLPTEAEWELAARGAAGRSFAWGTEAPSCTRACFGKNSDCRVGGEMVATCAVNQIKGDTTPEGILGLAGNVAEWVSDGWGIALPGGTDPKGPPSGALRVVRGGSFQDEDGDRLRATWRVGYAPSTAHVTIGFRCAQDP